MVSSQGASTRDRFVQCRLECGRSAGATHCPLDLLPLGLALGVLVHRFSQRDMAAGLASYVPPTARTSMALFWRTRLHRRRPDRDYPSHFLGAIAMASSNLGIRGRQVSDRSDLVVLSVLDSVFPTQQACFVP